MVTYVQPCSQAWTQKQGYHNTTVCTHPQDGFVAGVASLSEGLFVAALTEDLFLLKHKGGVVQLLVASVAGEVLRVPHSAHCTRKWATACV